MRYYRWDLLITAVIGAAIAMAYGLMAFVIFLLLVVVEVSLSGDNATVNVRLLKQLSKRWVFIFMTIGVAVAAGFMRFLFPILIVAITGHMSFGDAVSLALNDHHEYAERVEAAHPQIVTFGGVYLFMIAVTFFVVENREYFWFAWFERPLAKVGAKIENLAPIITSIIVLVLSALVPSSYQISVLLAGFISLVSYMTIKALSDLAQEDEDETDGAKTGRTGWAAFGIFMALEAQDAAFSFDGVSGALAITQDPIIIAAGLGVGALFVRSATKHLMETDKLKEFRYLGHAAFYGILVLAISQLVSLFVDIPGLVVGAVTVAIISSGVVHSHILNKREGTGESFIDEALGIDVIPDDDAAVSATKN